MTFIKVLILLSKCSKTHPDVFLIAIPCFALFTCVSKFCKNKKFCMKFVYLIFRKSFNLLTPNVRCYIMLKCTKIDFGWGYAPDPVEELTALPQTPQLDFKNPTSKER